MLRTQESGSSETLHTSRRTLPPRARPRPYQIVSAMTEAATLSPSASAKLILPVAPSAPMASRAGTAGRGTPIWSAKT